MALLFPTLAHAQDVVLVSSDHTALQPKEIPSSVRANIKNHLVNGYVVSLEKGETIASDPDYKVIIPAPVKALSITSDPLFYQQWGLKSLRADWIQAAGQLGSGIVIAVVDTGLFTNHADTPALQYSSDPSNPLIQTLGWNFVDDTGDTADWHGHGTAVSAIAAAPINQLGMQGLAPGAKILPIKVLGNGGVGNTADVASGIKYAADNGAHVINASLGATGDPGGLMSQSINYARSKGSLVVCASGNGGGNVVAFPGQTSSCMTVGAIDQDTGGRATFSQYGTGLDIVAPGTNIITPSIITTNLWERGAGTSFAAPHVAAAAALLYAQGLTISQVETKILTTTTDLGTVGWDPETGFGVLNTTAALGVTEPAQAGGASDPDPDPSPDPNPDPDEDSSLPCWQGTISLQAGNAALLPLDCQGQNFTYQLSNGTLSGKSYIPPAFWTGTATLRYRPLQGTTYYIVALNVVARTSKLAAKIKPTRTCLKLTLSRTGLIGKAKTTILVERKVGKKWKRIVASRFAWSKASHTSCLKKPKLRGIYRVRANVQSTTYSTQAASSRTFKL